MSALPPPEPSLNTDMPDSGEHTPDVSTPVEDLSPMELIWAVVQELLRIVVPAALVAFLIHLFLAETTIVFGASMEPILHHRQRLVVEKVSYRFMEPQRGDIVVVKSPDISVNLIKRVIGVPGDKIQVVRGLVYLNEQPLQEPYVQNERPQAHKDNEPFLILNDSQYYIMGDNRDNSRDSRSFGPIQAQEIVGRAWLRYWPLTDIYLFPD